MQKVGREGGKSKGGREVGSTEGSMGVREYEREGVREGVREGGGTTAELAMMAQRGCVHVVCCAKGVARQALTKHNNIMVSCGYYTRTRVMF